MSDYTIEDLKLPAKHFKEWWERSYKEEDCKAASQCEENAIYWAHMMADIINKM